MSWMLSMQVHAAYQRTEPKNEAIYAPTRRWLLFRLRQTGLFDAPNGTPLKAAALNALPATRL